MKHASHIREKSLILPLLGLFALTVSGCASSGTNGSTDASRMTSSIARPAQQRAEDDDEAPRPVPTDPYKNARYKGGRDPVSGIAPNLDGTLPEPPPPQRKAQSAGAGRAIAATRAQTVAIAQPSASASSVVAGPTVQVQPGDTLSKIARTNGVSVTALMQVNGLSTPAIMAGQTLVLPPK